MFDDFNVSLFLKNKLIIFTWTGHKSHLKGNLHFSFSDVDGGGSVGGGDGNGDDDGGVDDGDDGGSISRLLQRQFTFQ